MSKQDEQAMAALIAAMTKHDVYLHRYSSAVVNRLTEGFDSATGAMLRELSEKLDSLQPAELIALSRGKYHTARLKGVKTLIDTWAKGATVGMVAGFKERATELAGAETGFMAALIDKVVENAPAIAITGAATYAAAASTPMLGEFVEAMLADIPAQARKRVNSTIRQGVSDGLTNGQIIKVLRGTPALKFKDGILEGSRRHISTIVRTGINHVSATAYNETYEALGVKEVMFVSTLDGRTSKVCASLDGTKYSAGTAHPTPPIHYNCRSRIVPVMASLDLAKRPYVSAFVPVGQIAKDQRPANMIGQVKASTSYSSWFSSQPKHFQEYWLGPKRYSLYKNGGYTIDRFVDPLGKELTLEQLKFKDAATFKELFGA